MNSTHPDALDRTAEERANSIFSHSQNWISMGAEGSTHKADAQTDEKTLVQSPRSVESVSSFWASREWRGEDVDVESQPCRVHTRKESRVDAAPDSSLAKSFSMVLLISTFCAGIHVAFLSLMVDIGGDGFQSSFRSGQIYDTGGTLLGLLSLALDLSLAAFSGVNAAISSSKFVTTTGIPGRSRSLFSQQKRLTLVVAVLFDASMVLFIALYDTVIAVVIGSIILLGLIFITYDLFLLTRWNTDKLSQ
ncbi:hypothetical protein PC9H_002868 [Pleurotus ostreatus]|uniref:Uncharacterized protein n=1 Tax=Pleurotus ostreatus TaxID=5322 RepID=A0A8H7DUS3_PLEOS|nr:uncharacterized protein PC9H_002868 [Pleurotus ostreatus]KAF7436042.1 hypothetical protein PC9H_002868 [Pleurotus ostreatus]